jgi:hypothetical protein
VLFRSSAAKSAAKSSVTRAATEARERRGTAFSVLAASRTLGLQDESDRSRRRRGARLGDSTPDSDPFEAAGLEITRTAAAARRFMRGASHAFAWHRPCGSRDANSHGTASTSDRPLWPLRADPMIET